MKYLIHRLIAFIIFLGLAVNATFSEAANESGQTNPRTSYFSSQLELDTLSSALRVSYYDSLINYQPNKLPQLLLKKAEVLRDAHDSPNALKAYQQLRAMSKAFPINQQLETIYTIGTIQLDLSNHFEALKECTNLINFPKPDSLLYYNAKAYLTMANIYLSLVDTVKLDYSVKKGQEYLQKYRHLYHSNKLKYLKAGLMVREASVEMFKKNYPKALDLLLKAKKINPQNIHRIDINIGTLYSQAGENDIANKYYQQILNSDINDPEIKAVAAYNIVLESAKKKKYIEYLKLTEDYEDYLKFWNGTVTQISLFGMFGEAYNSFGNFKQALEYYGKADSLRNEIMSPEIIRQLERESMKIEMAEKDLEIANANKEKMKSRTVMWVCAAAAILMAAALVIALILIRRKTRKLNDRMALNDKQCHDMKIDKEDAESELELRNKEMASLTMQIDNINLNFASLKQLLSDPKAKKADIIVAAEKTMQSMSANSEVWDGFKVYFEQAHKDFFDTLYRLHPDLTNSEIRMCAFILLNRTNKEIATMLNRSIRTVETIKYTLRKKLNITEPTEVYLRKLSADSNRSQQ